jgi:hypothetical protein
LATRRMPASPAAGGRGAMLVWLGSLPNKETDWPMDSSFPLYFADLLATAFPAADTAGQSICDWSATSYTSSNEAASQLHTTVQLSTPVVVVAIVSLLVAMSLLIGRTRLA